MLSPSGLCRMWDAKADGYTRGEGIAAFFVKTLSRALTDGDQIQAIIRETGVNSDGRTKGITVLKSEAQRTLIRNTYIRSNLDPLNPEHRPQFFEAHGTLFLSLQNVTVSTFKRLCVLKKASLQVPELQSETLEGLKPSPKPSLETPMMHVLPGNGNHCQGYWLGPLRRSSDTLRVMLGLRAC